MLYIIDKLESIESVFSESMSSLLSAERYQKVQRLRSSTGRNTSAAAYLLLRFALREAYNLNEAVKFKFATKGKPALENYPHIHFNLSHSKGVVACVVADFEVGVDVQNIRHVSGKTAKRVLTEEEYVTFQKSDNPDEYFCKIWTIKESYVKMTGQGITNELREISAGEIKNIHTFKGENYYCSVCGSVASKSLACEAPEKVRHLGREDLEQFYK